MLIIRHIWVFAFSVVSFFGSMFLCFRGEEGILTILILALKSLKDRGGVHLGVFKINDLCAKAKEKPAETDSYQSTDNFDFCSRLDPKCLSILF